MEIKKSGNSYNKYSMELSYGELEAIISALTGKHEGPLADELFNGLNWYFQRLPRPGSEETKLKELDGGDDEIDDTDSDVGLDEPSQMSGEKPLPDQGSFDNFDIDLSQVNGKEPGDDDLDDFDDFDADKYLSSPE